VDLSAYSGDVRAAALREMERLRAATEPELDEAEFVTYGHIVIDEAQDLSPMEVRVIKRRDLTGSMTVVGDMGQATTPASSASWDAVLAELQPRQTPRRVDLTVSYRTPEEVLEFAAPTLRAAAAGLEPPRPVRRAGVEPRITETNPADLAVAVTRVVGEEVRAVAPGRVAVIAPRSRVSALTRALQEAGLDAVDPRDDDPRGLSADLVVVAAEGANGLEFDAVVVVEPAEIVARGAQPGAVTPRGLRTFYVAMTRPTRRLTLVTSQALPATINP
jgi:DNA helicase IV